MNKYIIVAAACLALGACTQAAAPTSDVAGTPNATQGTSDLPPAVAAATGELAAPPTTPPLSIVDDGLAAAAKGSWCLKDGTAPFTKIVIQDSSIVAPIENQSASKSVQKDTATQQAPGTGTATAATSGTFQIKWLRSGMTGTATIKVDGGSLSFTDESGSDTGTFTHCQ
ncbi:MAG: hypothetical protein COV45_06745 [Deltaproteobacteria bacterium CG11_big_fil_rev_8_21_14_0_20_47_16]|nr:MAG: hypothetical protein COV45_06745 [Deltaproteobacteria bacterium CG11_big_fil_rev_8_21_14_0_20_47_16]